MTREQAWLVMVPFALWCFAFAALFDRRWTRWALSRTAEGPEATRRMLRLAELRRLSLWLVVWVLAIALTENDPDNREAAVVVVPMVLAYGPRAYWRIWKLPRDHLEKGVDLEIAKATRAGTPLAVIGLFLCLVGLAVTFQG